MEASRRRTSSYRLLWPALALLAAVGMGLVYFVDPRPAGNYPPCLFLYFTGCYCPGCGTLRALHRLLHGDLLGALGYNPLTCPDVAAACYRRHIRPGADPWPSLATRFHYPAPSGLGAGSGDSVVLGAAEHTRLSVHNAGAVTVRLSALCSSARLRAINPENPLPSTQSPSCKSGNQSIPNLQEVSPHDLRSPDLRPQARRRAHL